MFKDLRSFLFEYKNNFKRDLQMNDFNVFPIKAATYASRRCQYKHTYSVHCPDNSSDEDWVPLPITVRKQSSSPKKEVSKTKRIDRQKNKNRFTKERLYLTLEDITSKRDEETLLSQQRNSALNHKRNVYHSWSNPNRTFQERYEDTIQLFSLNRHRSYSRCNSTDLSSSESFNKPSIVCKNDDLSESLSSSENKENVLNFKDRSMRSVPCPVCHNYIPHIDIDSHVNQCLDNFMDDMKDRTVYIRNISPDVKEGLIYELFLQAGPLESVKLIGDYGFVTFEHDCSVPYACSLLNDIMICTSYLSVKPRAGSKYESHQIVDAIPNRGSMMMAAQKNRIWQVQNNQLSQSHNSGAHNPRQQDTHSDYSRNRNSQSQRHDHHQNTSSRERSPVGAPNNYFASRNPESSRRQTFAQNIPSHHSREARPSDRDCERRNENDYNSMNELNYRHRDYSNSQGQRDYSGRYQPIDRANSYSGISYHDQRNNAQHSMNRSNSYYHQRSHHQDNYSRNDYHR